MTITLTNNGPKSPAPPWFYDDFEDGDLVPSPWGQTSAYTEVDHSMVLSSHTLMTGSNFHLNGQQGPSNRGGTGLRVNAAVGVSTLTLIIDRWRDHASGTNDKIFRIFSVGTSSPDYVISTQGGGIAFNEVDTNYPKRSATSQFVKTVSWIANVWDHEEFYYKHGNNTNPAPPGHLADGAMNYRKNGFDVVIQTDVPNGLQTIMEIWVAENFCSSDAECPTAPNNNTNTDNIYADLTYSMVFFSTASTFAATSQRKPLPAITWVQDGTITANFYGYDVNCSVVQCYLYAANAQNEVNTNGFAFTASGGAAGGAGATGTIRYGLPVRR
jgi:hypothetical protein